MSLPKLYRSLSKRKRKAFCSYGAETLRFSWSKYDPDGVFQNLGAAASTRTDDAQCDSDELRDTQRWPRRDERT